MSASTLTSAAPLTASSRRVHTAPAPTLAIYTRHLLESGLRTAAIWTLGLAGYLVAMIFSFHQIAPAVAQTKYPAGLSKAFGITDMQTITGFLSVEVFSFVPLCIAVYPLLVMAGTLSGAEERSRLDVLLGTPLSRKDLVLARVLSLGLTIVGMLVITAVLGWGAGIIAGEELPASTIFGAVLAMAPFMAFFGGIGLLASSLTHRFAPAMGVGLGILLLMYLLDVIGKIIENDRIGWLSAFHFYGTPMTDGVNWGGAIGMTVAAILMVIAAIVAFERRDIFS